MERFTDRWGRLDALLIGMTIGFAQYFYVSNRILGPIAATYIGAYIVSNHFRRIREFRRYLWRAIHLGAIAVSGIVVSTLPLAAYYSKNPTTFSARTQIVSVFGSGWLERERELTGSGNFRLLWGQFERAALLPFHTMPTGFYRTESPFAGWPIAIPAAIGIGIVTIGFWDRRYMGIAIAWWAGIVALGLTEGPPQTNRLSMAAALLPILATISLVSMAQIFEVYGRISR